MAGVRDHVYSELQKLNAHYTGKVKPKIITLYRQLTTLKKNKTKNVKDLLI